MNAAQQSVIEAMRSEYMKRCHQVPRGMFFSMGDDLLKAGLIFAAVASVVAPMVYEIERLRRKLGLDKPGGN